MKEEKKRNSYEFCIIELHYYGIIEIMAKLWIYYRYLWLLNKDG